MENPEPDKEVEKITKTFRTPDSEISKLLESTGFYDEPIEVFEPQEEDNLEQDDL